MTSNINDKMKGANKRSTSNNNQSTKPINDANKKKDSMNFKKLIKTLSTSPNTQPWYKKKASIIAMSSTLGVGALATVIAVPIVLTSQSASTKPKPITVAEFNALPLDDKISAYNKMMLDNNQNILNHSFLNNGFSNFLTSVSNIPQQDMATFNAFITFWNSIKFDNALTTGTYNNQTFPINFVSDGINHKDTFLNFVPNPSNNLTNFPQNFNDTYNFAFSLDPLQTPPFVNVTSINLYSNFIESLSINNNFTMSFKIKSSFLNNSHAMRVLNGGDAIQETFFKYKSDITINNSNLFPGMTNYVNTTILNNTSTTP